MSEKICRCDFAEQTVRLLSEIGSDNASGYILRVPPDDNRDRRGPALLFDFSTVLLACGILEVPGRLVDSATLICDLYLSLHRFRSHSVRVLSIRRIQTPATAASRLLGGSALRSLAE